MASCLSIVQCVYMCVCAKHTWVECLVPHWYIRGALAEAGKKRGMREGCSDGVEVRVREEEGLAFQYPERITARALDGWSPQSYTGLRGGRMKGGEREERAGCRSAGMGRVRGAAL